LNTSLLQLGAWNLQGKTSDSAIDVLHDFGMDLHVLALQEVGGVASDDVSQTVRLSLHEGYMLLTARPAGCFRALSLAIDEDCVSTWFSGGVGHSYLCALIQLPFFVRSFVLCPCTCHTAVAPWMTLWLLWPPWKLICRLLRGGDIRSSFWGISMLILPLTLVSAVLP
jgi:hypothetical protein